MTTRAGEIECVYYRVSELGKLKIIGDARGASAQSYEDGTKVNKITIANLNTCSEGIYVTVAFIDSTLADSTALVSTDKGFYVYYKKALALGNTLIIDRHYFERFYTFILGERDRSHTKGEKSLQIAVRIDFATGSKCTTSDDNPLADVHITK